MNDQENIQRIRKEEWDQIRSDMEAGSSDIIRKANYFEDRSSMALILKELKEELKRQGDILAVYESEEWEDENEWITQGWCGALEYAIKVIEKQNDK
jgi:hypothetical protein